MKIGLTRRGYSPTGGAEAYLRRFAAAVVEEGHDPVLFPTSRWDAWPGRQLAALPGRSPKAYANAVRTAMREGACDYLFSLERVWSCHAYRAGDGVHRAWLERRKRHEPFWRSWTRRFSGKHRELLALEAALFSPEGAGQVIANSGMVRQEIIASYGYPAERIHVVYNGLPLVPEPLPGERARARAALGVHDHASPLILFAGSGWERKGLRYAIDAVNLLNAQPAPAGSAAPQLLVAGRGSRRALPDSAHVRFLGPIRSVSEMQTLYEAADLFLLPTLYDPFSNACLEALAAGLPVITTTANGFSEIIRPGEEGEAIDDPADVSALARALRDWIDSERLVTLRPRLRTLGARYSIEANVEATLALLQETRG